MRCGIIRLHEVAAFRIADMLVIFATLILTSCAMRPSMSEKDAVEIIRSDESFRARGVCNGRPAEREIISVLEASPVTCESSINECTAVVRIRWRWLYSTTREPCPGSSAESVLKLARDSDKHWTVATPLMSHLRTPASMR